MLTMERPQIITTGTNLLCYMETNQFTEGNEYTLIQGLNGGYFVESDTDQLVYFNSLKSLKEVFMIEG